MTVVLDGFNVAKNLRESLKLKTASFIAQGHRAPSLTVVIVGDDPASQTYVASKGKQANAVGYTSNTIALPENTSTVDLLEVIDELNGDDCVDGILVQLPLPKHIDEDEIIDRLDPRKDVDGLTPTNVAFLELNRPQHVPCTPSGIMHLLDAYNINVEGKRALVIGRSRLVGKPVASLLLQRNATVTIAHSKTKDLEKLVREHDIIVVAIGRPEYIPASWIDDHHVLIDVGIHRIDGKLCGDVERSAYEKAAYATPVPKGVGPMTIACLLENTMKAYEQKVHHD